MVWAAFLSQLLIRYRHITMWSKAMLAEYNKDVPPQLQIKPSGVNEERMGEILSQLLIFKQTLKCYGTKIFTYF